MKIDFRIDWGYQYLYSRRHYHPFYIWDGKLECENGTVTGAWQLDYPVIWFGPGHCANETKLEAAEWKSTTRRGLAGVRFTAEVNENSVFHLKTASGNFDFTANDILKNGRLVFNVGPKYLGCHVIVTKTGYYWFVPEAKDGQQVFEVDDFAGKLEIRNWARMRTAWLEPGKRVKFEAVIPEKKKDYSKQLLHVVCMAAPGYTPEKEQQYSDYITINLYCDGKLVVSNRRFYRSHDVFMQILEDLWLNFEAEPGKHSFELENANNDDGCFLITRMILQTSNYAHLEFSLPQWAQTNCREIGKVFSVQDAEEVTIQYPGNSLKMTLQKGWNEFVFNLSEPGKNIKFTCGKREGVIPEVYDVADETPEVMVGYDMTTVPHDVDGYMDWLLDYTYRTKLSNIVVFRPHFNGKYQAAQCECSSTHDSGEFKNAFQNDYEADPEELRRWGKFCCDHKIYVESVINSKELVEGAGKMMHSSGRHEWPGVVYAMDPQPGFESPDMKTAAEQYLQHLKVEIDKAHAVCPRSAFGDASGGHRYCYMAGVDFIRSETMVSHTQHLCSQARPAAEVFRNGEWGVHIAIQHATQPYFENHLGLYYLSIMQPWMMGANMIYEEDCLFNLFKEERQAWDDALTKGKRDMTRWFFKFAKTHPRKGKVNRRIAFVEGRYAAPFNGFICDAEQTPDYSVWGKFGNNDSTWRHNQVEKCRHVLDVLMPGASTQPFRQDFNKRRFFFSGTPYGDFDEVPTEASADYLKQYSLLLHMGWNTMIDEDYDKLREFVGNGGTLLIGLTQFSRHVKRDFLRDMEDLDLYNDGDLSELCGVKVKGKGELFSGQWNAVCREKFPQPDLSAIPSSSRTEDGSCCMADIELAGAEPFIWDAAKRHALVVRHRYGKGTVYLLTAYAYFGHEDIRQIMANLVALLAQDNLPECSVEDASREVFWNMWDESKDVKRIMLLNTDWTEKSNIKPVTVKAAGFVFDTEVKEREAKLLTVLKDAVIDAPTDIFVEVTDGAVKLHGSGNHTIKIYRKDSVETREIAFSTTTILPLEL
ncbi:MAG: hypothetical protein J6S90_04875 [Lentisphaeria bacterium]|nr:hypothetical protein [Lentisphaeria bacterium]